jgi:predicted RNase H-like nuclease
MGAFVGVDWGGKRWVTAADCETEIAFATAPSFQAVCRRHADATLLLVDMPVGLPPDRESSPRPCDVAARDAVHPSRKRSVFDVPARGAVAATTYEEACERNREALGWGDIGPQTWGIVERIHEVDVFLRASTPALDVRESHPEVCFAALAGDDPVTADKTTAEGREERLAALDALGPRYRAAFESLTADVEARSPWKRRLGVGMFDDALDALGLAAAARAGTERGLAVLGGGRDAAGLPMEIVTPRLDR